MSPIIVTLIIVIIILIVILFAKGEEGLGRIINLILPNRSDHSSQQSIQQQNQQGTIHQINNENQFQNVLKRLYDLEQDNKSLKKEVREIKNNLMNIQVEQQKEPTPSRSSQPGIIPQPINPQVVRNSHNLASAQNQNRQTFDNNIVYCGLPHRGIFPIVSPSESFYVLEKQSENIASFSVNVKRSIPILESYDLAAASVCQIVAGNINLGTQIRTHRKGRAELTPLGWQAKTMAQIIVE